MSSVPSDVERFFPSPAFAPLIRLMIRNPLSPTFAAISSGFELCNESKHAVEGADDVGRG